MSSDKARNAPALPEYVLPLPAKPNLEFERKRAKRMLRSIIDGDTDALGRIHRYRPGIAATEAKLSDVQLTIAREYGFTSWPKLVSYYETFDRHDRAGPRFQSYSRDHYEHRVQTLIIHHGHKQPYVTRTLAAFVPRFYGRSDEEIFSSQITEADAQLVVARNERFSSWDALIEFADAARDLSTSTDESAKAKEMQAWQQRRYGKSFMDAFDAIKQRDLKSLTSIVDAHPELLETPAPSNPGDSLLRSAILFEQNEPSAERRSMSDFLVSRGADLETILGRMLLSGIHRKPEDVAALLNRGANPDWLPPDGIPILEHALINYWNPEAVDLIAQRVTPRKAFWIAAGLGDVPTMLSFLDKDGKPNSAARANRPDFTLVGFNSPCRPEPDDLEIIWEAFCIAGFNQRLDSLDALLDRGFPIDYSEWGATLFKWTEGNGISLVAEHLKKRGARQ
jgi:hypothetical protein